jgi:hypothetical protein
MARKRPSKSRLASVFSSLQCTEIHFFISNKINEVETYFDFFPHAFIVCKVHAERVRGLRVKWRIGLWFGGELNFSQAVFASEVFAVVQIDADF